MGEKLNILCQSSDYYAPFAGVMLTSLFDNNKDIKQIRVYLMTSDMSGKNRERFQTLSEQYQRRIKFIDTKEIDCFLKNNKVPKYNGAYTTYYKIFALSVIEDELDRLIYFDSDMVVTGSLAELMICDMENHVIGMCIDKMPERYRRLMLCNSDFYYNAGMIVFDAKKWIIENCDQRIINHIVNIRSAYPYVDQDLINIVFLGEIKTLPQKYNFDPEILWYNDYKFYKEAYGLENYYSMEEFTATMNNPTIIHCMPVFAHRPWFDEDYPAKEKWHQYLELSPWKEMSCSKHSVPFKHKVQDYLYHYAPRKVFAAINRNSLYVSLWLRERNLRPKRN